MAFCIVTSCGRICNCGCYEGHVRVSNMERLPNCTGRCMENGHSDQRSHVWTSSRYSSQCGRQWLDIRARWWYPCVRMRGETMHKNITWTHTAMRTSYFKIVIYPPQLLNFKPLMVTECPFQNSSMSAVKEEVFTALWYRRFLGPWDGNWKKILHVT